MVLASEKFPLENRYSDYCFVLCKIDAAHTCAVNQHTNYLQTLVPVMRRKGGRKPSLYSPSGGQREKEPGRTKMVLKQTPLAK